MTMKWRPFLVMAAVTLFMAQACSGVSPYRYWNTYTMTEPVLSSDKSFSDERIRIRFWMDEKKIHFQLANLTGQPMTIDWRKAAYIHIDGLRHPVANIDSTLTDRKDDPPPTVIPPGETIDDFVTPSKNIKRLEEWTWYIYPLFNLFDEKAYDNKGKIFGLDFPVKTGGKWYTYKFRFEISNVIPSSRRL